METQSTPSGPDKEVATTPPSPKPGHPRVVVALLIAATLLTVVAIFSIWINRQALNTDNWVNTSAKLLQNKDIQGQLAIYMSDQLFENVNVEEELQKALPPKLAPLAGPASGALEQLGPQAAEKALERPKVQELWESANRAAHEALLKVIDGGGPAVSTSGGEVTLNLGTLLGQVGEKLGVGGKIAEKVPPEAGQITVLKSNDLSTAQSAAQLIRRLPVVLTLLVILLYGLAIYLAGPRRREALRSVGICFLLAGVLTLILRGFVGNEVVDALAKSESVKPATEAVWSIGYLLAGHRCDGGHHLRDPARDRGLGGRAQSPRRAVPPRGRPACRRESVRRLRRRRTRFSGADRLGTDPSLRHGARNHPLCGAVALGTEALRRQILRESSERSATG